MFEEDLESALAALFGAQSGFDQSPATPDSETGETPTTPTQPETTGDPELDLALALADMRSAIERGKQALENQDFAAYGEAQKDLEAALDRALADQRLVDGALALPEDATVDEEILDTETTA